MLELKDVFGTPLEPGMSVVYPSESGMRRGVIKAVIWNQYGVKVRLSVRNNYGSWQSTVVVSRIDRLVAAPQEFQS